MAINEGARRGKRDHVTSVTSHHFFRSLLHITSMATDPVNQPPSTPSSGKEPEISVKATGVFHQQCAQSMTSWIENIEPLVAVIDLTASDIEDASEERSSRARSSEFREEDEDWGNEEIEYADPEEQLADDLDGAARKQLQSAIATVPIRRLREIVARVALTDAAVEHSLAHELLGLNTTTRTLVPRWAVCMHCGDEYSPQQQGDELDCAFHEGSHDGPAP
jgi:hypothetical protein